MNKIKIILGYLFSFILSILIFLLCLLFAVKINIDKDNVKRVLDRNNYYENVYNEILEEMQNYMVSSGLSDEVLDNIFSKEIVTKDINTYIDNIYLGKVNNVDTTNIKENLTNNINSYLKEHDLNISSQKTLDMFKDDITKIYAEEINLYNMLNGFVNFFYKINNLLNTVMYILIISIIINLVLCLLLKVKYFGSILMSSGLMIILTKYLILDNIEINFVTIITDNFSKVLRTIANTTIDKLVIWGIILIIIGTLINIFMSSKGNKRLKNN